MRKAKALGSPGGMCAVLEGYMASMGPQAANTLAVPALLHGQEAHAS